MRVTAHVPGGAPSVTNTRGAVTFTVEPGDLESIPFVLVRVQAKLEAPLKGLTKQDVEDLFS